MCIGKCRFLAMVLGPLSFAGCAPNAPSAVESIQSTSQASTEDGTWIYADKMLMKAARHAHTALKLSDGRVLVVGGTENPAVTAELFTFDIQNGGTWTQLPGASVLGIVGNPVCRPGMAQLDDNTVLVAATNSTNPMMPTTSVWLYDPPPKDIWSHIDILPEEACVSTVVALKNNRALVLTTNKTTNQVSSFLYNAGNVAPTLAMPVPAAGSWAGFAAINIDDTHVLVSGGGLTAATLTNESIVYDATTNGWTSAGNMVLPRAGHAVAILPSGDVLAVGGTVTGPFTGQWGDTAEIFDVATMLWAPTAPMFSKRIRHTATTLLNGLILVTGGSTSSTAELFDASTQTWTALESADDFRFFGHQATPLDNGPVIITGGLRIGETTDGGTNDVASNAVVTCEANSLAWETRASLPALNERGYHSATKLDDGTLLVVGGVTLDNTHQFADPLDAAYIYDDSANTWTDAAKPSVSRALHTATKLQNGRVLLAGGWKTSSAEIFDPKTNTWQSAASLPKAIMWATATLLPDDEDVGRVDGRVLHIGGVYSEGTASTASEVLLYNPTTNQWASGPTLVQGTQSSRFGHTATLLQNGTVLVVGGAEVTATGSVNTPVADAAYFDPKTDTWTTVASMKTPRAFHSATLLTDGRVLVAGGGIPSELVPNGILEWSTIYTGIEIYDPTANTWTPAETMFQARVEHQAILLESDLVLVAGGRRNNYGGILASAEIFDPYEEEWFQTARMQSPRYGHTLTLFDGGVITVGGIHPFVGMNSPPERFPQIPQGGPCATDDQCLSTFCADGYCCDQSCESPCLACSAARGSSANGTCEIVKDCGQYACVLETGACKETCASVNDCATGYVCDPSSKCIDQLGNQSVLDEASCAASSSTQSNAPPWPGLMLVACAFAWRRHHTRKNHRKL